MWGYVVFIISIDDVVLVMCLFMGAELLIHPSTILYPRTTLENFVLNEIKMTAMRIVVMKLYGSVDAENCVRDCVRV